MDLARLQDLFQRGVLGGDGAVLSEVLDSAKENRNVLFDVYRLGHPLRLTEALQKDHETLHAYMGDEAFAAMARAYIDATPSSSPSLRWFSERLPAFLTTAEPYRDYRQIGELAAIENALNDAFDAPDAPVVTIADFAAIPPALWPTTCFTAHPSVMRLDLNTNAAAIWSALNNGEAPPDSMLLDRPVGLIVWREDNVARFRKLAEPERMMWAEAACGIPFGVLCEMIATYDDHDPATRAAGYLQGWIAGGLLTALQYTP